MLILMLLYTILHPSSNLYAFVYRQYSTKNIQCKVMCGALDV